MPHFYCSTLRLYTQQIFSQPNLKWNGKWGWHVLITVCWSPSTTHVAVLSWACWSQGKYSTDRLVGMQSNHHKWFMLWKSLCGEDYDCMCDLVWLVTSLGIPVKRIYDCFHSVCESRHWGVATCWLPLKLYPDFIHFCWCMMNWCLMSSDVSWHIRDKLWPMLKHGSIILYVHRNQKAR